MSEIKMFKRGFTLLELIVGMAIVAVLIGLSLLGIQTVQRSSRDQERRTTLEAINLELANYYGVNSSYPASLTVNAAGTLMTVGTKTVTLKGAALNKSTLAITAPDATGTRYCYAPNGSSYIVGVGIESSTTAFTLGTATVACTAF